MLFGSSEGVFEDRTVEEVDIGFVYFGKADEMPRDMAEKIAELHIDTYEYFESNMVPLYKGYGKLRGGTEDPVWAIQSRCSLEFVYIKEIFDDRECYPSK